MTTRGRLTRRTFLIGTAGSLGAGALAGCASKVQDDLSPGPSTSTSVKRSIPRLQPLDVTTRPPAAGTIVAFDVKGAVRSDLARLLREITERVGAIAPGASPAAPPDQGSPK
jgi:hypothetical protein